MIANIKEALAVVAGAVGAASLCYLLYKSILEAEQEWKAELAKKPKVDRLKLNTMIMLIQAKWCPVHVAGSLRCQDPECGYYPLSFMLDLIDKANKSIELSIYIITAPVIAAAIIKAHKRGLRVRVIADADMAFSDKSCINEFVEHEVPVRMMLSSFIMHHKFILVDDEIVFSGSLNFTMSGILCNWENVIVSSHPKIVKPFIIEFQTIWEDFAPKIPLPAFKRN